MHTWNRNEPVQERGGGVRSGNRCCKYTSSRCVSIFNLFLSPPVFYLLNSLESLWLYKGNESGGGGRKKLAKENPAGVCWTGFGAECWQSTGLSCKWWALSRVAGVQRG